MRFQMNQRVRCEFLLDDHILRGKASMHLNHENRRKVAVSQYESLWLRRPAH